MRFQRRQLIRILSGALGSGFIWSRKRPGIAAQTATQPKTSTPPAGATAGHELAGGTKMEKVTGIGGLFFRAHDPKALARWYQEHLGIAPTPTSHEDTVWEQEAGPTVFEISESGFLRESIKRSASSSAYWRSEYFLSFKSHRMMICSIAPTQRLRAK